MTVILEEKPSPSAGVGATIGRVANVHVGGSVREAIQQKAKKNYGELDGPFVIAIWPKLPWHFSVGDNDDLVALYGDKIWVCPAYDSLREAVTPNGVFNMKRSDGSCRYPHVSAVLFYGQGNPDPLRLYHNPFAQQPVEMNVFSGIPQCRINMVTGKEQWSRP